MLVLMRKSGQSIDITTPCGERIVVTVIAAFNGSAKVGVHAADNIVIDREEVTARKQAELAAL